VMDLALQCMQVFFFEISDSIHGKIN